jgi:hypothetical protein
MLVGVFFYNGNLVLDKASVTTMHLLAALKVKNGTDARQAIRKAHRWIREPTNESMVKVTVKRSITAIDLINFFVIWGVDRHEMVYI